MSYRFKKEENVRAGITRIAREELRDALALVRTGGKEEVVHEVRRTLKRLRAMLRLARGGMSRDNFSREDTAFRNLGKSLSEARDAQICVDSTDSLRTGLEGQAGPAVLPRVRRKLTARLRRIVHAAENAGWRQRIAKELREALARVPAWMARELEWDDLFTMLRKSYRRARHGFAEARTWPSAKNLHQWRKHTKRLSFHLRLLETASPEVMHELAREAEALGGHLGDEHDFVVLEAVLADDREKLSAVDALSMKMLIKVRRAQLRKAAFALGRRFFVEKPRAFAVRIEDSRKLWRAPGRRGTNHK